MHHQIIDPLVQLLSLSPEEIASLASYIRDCIMATMQSVYNRVGSLLQTTAQWVPDLTSISHQALSYAHDIARTYADEIRSAITNFVEQYEIANSTIEGVQVPLASFLQEWLTARASYKARQIAGFSAGVGNEAAIAQCIKGINAGIRDDAGNVIDPSDYCIQITPDESSSDVCSQYAGQSFPLDQADDLPSFPIHPNCPHQKHLVVVAGDV